MTTSILKIALVLLVFSVGIQHGLGQQKGSLFWDIHSETTKKTI